MDFLCDAMDLKQSVGGTLKVLGKSLTTVLDEVHFIFNLSSFPLPLFPQSKPFLPQGKSFAPLPGRATSKTPLSFSVSPSFLRISQFPGCNQRNGKQCWLSTLSFKISLKDTSFHISINSLGLYLSPECLFNFLSKFYIPPCAGKISNFHSNSSQSSCHHDLDRRKLLIPLGSVLSKTCFSQQQKGVEETICFVKIQSEKMKMTWYIRFFIFV